LDAHRPASALDSEPVVLALSAWTRGSHPKSETNHIHVTMAAQSSRS
jgi:hypothetical protein